MSIQFSVFHQAKRWFVERNQHLYPGKKDLFYGQYYAAGAIAGIANSFVAGPVEHVRIRLQTQPVGEKQLYNGPVDCVKRMIHDEGLFKGLYRGQMVTILREAQAYGLWFLTYEWLMHNHISKGTKREDVASWRLAVYGATAGYVLWLGSYPFDVIKSRIQSDFSASGVRKFTGNMDAVRKTWAEGGMAAFWRGILPTMLRAAPASGGTFLA